MQLCFYVKESNETVLKLIFYYSTTRTRCKSDSSCFEISCKDVLIDLTICKLSVKFCGGRVWELFGLFQQSARIFKKNVFFV